MKKNFLLLLLIALLAKATTTMAQNVGIGTITPDPSARLEVSSTSSGLLLPRMTTAQRNAIMVPAKGLMVFDTDSNSFWFFNGNAWTAFAGGTATNYWAVNNPHIFNSNPGNVGIGLTNPIYKLDIKGRIRIKADSIGQSGSTPGIWLDNFLTGSEQAFIGMENDVYAGFFGKAGAGWGINFNTQSGNVNMGNSGYNIYRLNLSNNDFGLALYGSGNSYYGSMQRDNQGNLAISSATGSTTPSTIAKHIILNPTSLGFISGNVGIGNSVPDYKLTVQSGKIEANTNTSLLKLVGQNPVMVLSSGANDYAYIKAWTYQPTPGFTNGLVLGAAPGNAIFLSTNYGATVVIDANNNVGIGTSSPAYKLSVNGTIQAKELRVETGWADFVFDKGYRLPSLIETEQYIRQHKHLQGIPAAEEIQRNGLAVSEVQTQMMQKIEELTLYVIELNKKITQLENKRK